MPPVRTVTTVPSRRDGTSETRSTTMSGQPSKWAQGYALFASITLMMVGSFHVISGIGGIAKDEIYAVTPNWVLQFDATTWGWIHVIGGILVAMAGMSILKGHMYGRIVGTLAALISAIVTFAWLPYNSSWAVLTIALDFGVIWALTVHGHEIGLDA
jgi:hypothetical protein